MAVSLIPQAMTSNTAPAPYVASASSTYGTIAYPFKAFDKQASTGWMANATTGWLQIDLGTASTASSYSIAVVSGNAARAPKTWTLQGSSDGTNWTTLDSRSNVSWPTDATQEFTVATSGAHRYYRIDVTANNGHASWLQIAELDLLGAEPLPTGTLAGTLPKLTGSFAGTYTPPPASAVLAGTLPKLTGSFAATSAQPPATVEAEVDTFNRANGRIRTGIAEAWVEYDLDDLTEREPLRIMAQQMPTPTLVDGRPA